MPELIVVFTKRLHIGLTAIAYHADLSREESIELQEQVHAAQLKDRYQHYSEPQKEVVRLLDRITDQSLFKKFSRQENIKAFKDAIPEDLMEKRIRPNLEQVMQQLIPLLNRWSVPAYFRREGYTQLYHSDALKIHKTPAIPLFRFDLKDETLTYTLELKQDNEVIVPAGKNVDIISHSPAVLKINNKILHFTDFEAAKIKPFLRKLSLKIPAQHLNTYMEGFVANCIRHHEVNYNGFTIQKKSDAPKSFIILEKDLAQNPVLNLHFQYGNRRFLADRKSGVFVDVVHNSQGYTYRKITRDFDLEKETFKLLDQLGLLQKGEATFIHPGDQENTTYGPENLVEWVRAHKETLRENHIEVQLKYNGTTFSQSPVINRFISRSATDWFEIKTIVEIPPHKIPFYRFRNNILSGDRYFRLPDDETFILPEVWFTRYWDLFSFGEVKDAVLKLDKLYFHLIEEADSHSGNGSPNKAMIPDLKTFSNLPLPRGLNATLRPYQTEGYQWFNFLSANNYGGILADDMGLGKTVQTIALLLKTYGDQKEKVDTPAPSHDSAKASATVNPQTFDDGKKESVQLSLFSQPVKEICHTPLPPSLIVMPTSLVHNWMAEIKKFAPSLKTRVFTDQNRARSHDVWRIFRHYHVIITTYGVLRNDVKFFNDYEFKYLILDESQQIKNPFSKTFQAVREVKAKHHLALTGTPIENSLVDLWAQMHIVNKKLLGSLSSFQRQFVNPITKDEDQKKTDRLQKLIAPFMLRRTKEMVARDLPPRMEQVVYCDMTTGQKEFYEREKSGIRNALFEAMEKGQPSEYAFLALKSLSRLRQIANHPATVEPDYEGGSGKFDQIMESLESIIAEHHHILLFSSFVKDLKLIENELKTRKIQYAKLTGATQNRQEVIESFSRDAQCKVFLISLKAGGVGLNLTKADYVFMLNPWWNPAAEAQAINRAHRIGQKRNVFVYRFITTETIEEKIARLQEKKSMLADTFVKSNNPLGNMKLEEIKELFK